MNAKELYDGIIEEIEANASNADIDGQDIALGIVRSTYYDIATLNTIFKFMTDMTLKAYIKERKLMAAYHFLTTQKSREIIRASQIAGSGHQQRFTNDFKNRFGMTPGKAYKDFKETNTSLFEPPRKWDVIADEAVTNKQSEKNGGEHDDRECR